MSDVAQSETINIYESFNLIDVMHKCPYADDAEALTDLKKCFVHCVNVPPVFMIKSYDAIEELPKVSYTSEAVAKQILKGQEGREEETVFMLGPIHGPSARLYCESVEVLQ